MPFIGNQPALSYTSFAKQDFTTSATTSYTLDHPVTNENEIALFINFVRQEPTTAYTATGTSLTLTSATSASDDMYCVFLGKAVQTVNPPSGSVGSSQVASTIITGQTAETSIATDDLILLSDTSASGALKKMTRANFVSGIGGTNTPAFSVTLSGTQSCSNNTSTVIVFNSEHYDTDSAYDTSNGRFTVPSGEGGKYAFFVSLRFDQTTSNRNAVDIRINNSSNTQQVAFENAGPQYTTIGGAVSINLSAGDYVYAEYYQSSGGTIDVRTDSHFSGFKLI
jgi:hypothetical protein